MTNISPPLRRMNAQKVLFPHLAELEVLCLKFLDQHPAGADCEDPRLVRLLQERDEALGQHEGAQRVGGEVHVKSL